MELAAVYHDAVIRRKFHRSAVNVIRHAAGKNDDEFQVFMPVTDCRIVGVSGENAPADIERIFFAVIVYGFGVVRGIVTGAA